MREVVGLKTIDGILTSDRKSIEPDVQARMQQRATAGAARIRAAAVASRPRSA